MLFRYQAYLRCTETEDENGPYKPSGSFQIRPVYLPFDTSCGFLFLLDELPCFLLLRSRSDRGRLGISSRVSGIFDRLSLYSSFGDGFGVIGRCADTTFGGWFGRALVLKYRLEHSTGFEVLDRALGIDTPVEHSNEVMGAGADKINVVGNKDLEHVAVSHSLSGDYSTYASSVFHDRAGENILEEVAGGMTIDYMAGMIR